MVQTADDSSKLEEFGKQQLYTTDPTSKTTCFVLFVFLFTQQVKLPISSARIATMKKLNRSLIFNFLELLDLLTRAPHLVQKKIEDIHVIFVNFHHFINEFRPHEVRPPFSNLTCFFSPLTFFLSL